MIFDVFNFFNELELLEIRLNELDDFVDKFVLIESTKTFQNNPKELIYEKNKDLFKKWHDKIIHVVIEDSPDTDDSWAVEYFQFNAASRVLGNAKKNDIIMWCCTDEIPKKSSIVEFIKKPSDPAMMMQYSLGGYLNSWHKDHGWWTGSRLVTGKQWNNSKNQYVDFRKDWLGVHVQDGGWHFCNMGGIERYRLKIQSYGHKELNYESFLSQETLEKKFKVCYDLYDPDEKTRKIELMPWSMLPPYIEQNKEKFAHMLIPN